MASTLTFDTSDPDIKTLIDSWADNTEYTVMVTLTTGAGEARNVGTISEVVDESEAYEDTEEAAPAPAPAPAATPAPAAA